MSAPARRTGRRRKANTKYLNDGWDKETLKLLRESSESSGSSPPPTVDGSQEPDNEFHGHGKTPTEHVVLSDDDDVMSVVADGKSAATSDVVTSEDDVVDTSRRVKRTHTEFSDWENDPKQPVFGGHTRGIAYTNFQTLSQDVAYQHTFGPELEDLEPILRARDIWMHARDVTFPSRTSLNQQIEHTVETERDHVVPTADSTQDVVAPRNSSFSQSLEPHANIASKKKYINVPPAHDVVLGPWQKQRIHSISSLEAINFGEAWPVADLNVNDIPTNINTSVASEEGNNIGAAKGVEQQVAPDVTSPKTKSYHEGWLLNTGAKVQTLAWAPQRGTTQYLAIACRSSDKQRAMAPPTSESRGPAFVPTAQYPANIQLWAIHPMANTDSTSSRLDLSAAPDLVKVLCTDYGDIKQLVWSPLTYINDTGENRLAVVSSDGCVRVISVPEHHSPSEDTSTFVQIRNPAYVLTPAENAIFTTAAFASATDLLLGTSDGAVHIYDIASDQVTPSEDPHIRVDLTNTYIMGLCPSFPSTLPIFLATLSASSDFLLTDLRNPQHDRIHLHQTHLPTRNLFYSPMTRCWLTTINSSSTTESESRTRSSVVAHNLRHFHRPIPIADLPKGSGTITSMAGSPWHPCLLTGTSAGLIYGTNVIRRIIPTALPPAKNHTIGYLQKLCEYEWRPVKEIENSARNIDVFHGRDARAGVSRFYEGFQPQKIEDPTPIVPGRKNKVTERDESPEQVVFEEEQAVTAIAWNPNRECAGWAAMGWGSGVVRIQDLAVDTT